MRHILIIVCSLVLLVTNASAEEKVRLPFATGTAIQCVQNSGETFSHNKTSTQFDLDFSATVGTPVHAARSGKVRLVNNTCDTQGFIGNECGGKWGNYIVIEHSDSDPKTETIYAHLKKDSILVREGEYAIIGDKIAEVGSSGWSSGAHLHFGTHKPFNTSVAMEVYAVERINNSAKEIIGMKWFRTDSDTIKSDLTCGLSSGHLYEAVTISDYEPAIFTDGAHTHIIHEDVRCSNGLCWEDGGDTNCWDAHNWFEIEGNDVYGTRTPRDISMCDEVYGSAVWNVGGFDSYLVFYDSQSGVGGGGSTGDWTPTTCTHIAKNRVYINATDERIDDNTDRIIPQSTVLRLEAQLEQGGSDAESCRRSPDLQTVETGFYSSNDGGDKELVMDDSGESYEKTQMANLTAGSTHTESRLFEVIAPVGTVKKFYTCADENDDLNNGEDECRTEELTVGDPPTYDVVLYGMDSSGTTYPGDTWTFHYSVSNIGSGTIPQSIGIVHMRDDTVFDTQYIGESQLTPNAVVGLSVSGTETSLGTKEIQACYQGGDLFTEVSTTNNCTNIGELHVVQRPEKPVGHLDAKNCDSFRGWAKDPNSTQALWMHIYRDGQYYRAIKADQYRSDLPYSDKNHGFTWDYPWWLNDNKTHNWKIYALDDNVTAHAGNTLIANFNQYCANTMPSGNLEHATRTSVHGWGWDPDRPDTAINIHVYTEWGYRGGGNAPHYRSDLPGNKRHAFNISTDDLCWGITDGWANVKVAYLDTLSGHRWSNTLNLPCP